MNTDAFKRKQIKKEDATKKKRRVSLLPVMLLMMLSATVMPVSALESKAEQMLSVMSTEDKISQMIMPAFRAYTEGEVTILDATIIQRYPVSLSCPEGIGEPINDFIMSHGETNIYSIGIDLF